MKTEKIGKVFTTTIKAAMLIMKGMRLRSEFWKF